MSGLTKSQVTMPDSFTQFCTTAYTVLGGHCTSQQPFQWVHFSLLLTVQKTAKMAEYQYVQPGSQEPLFFSWLCNYGQSDRIIWQFLINWQFLMNCLTLKLSRRNCTSIFGNLFHFLYIVPLKKHLHFIYSFKSLHRYLPLYKVSMPKKQINKKIRIVFETGTVFCMVLIFLNSISSHFPPVVTYFALWSA